MAFIAAGISAVYTVEKLPYAMASLIQMAVLYFDYMLVYLFNGWLPVSALPVFSLIFFVGFAVIWFIIYLSIKRATGRMNSKLKNNVE
jgi:Flagellar biosynthesis/type III secretory pathway lipoprotein